MGESGARADALGHMNVPMIAEKRQKLWGRWRSWRAPLEDPRQLVPAGARQAGVALRVVSYNIHKGWGPFNRHLTIAEMREALRDVGPTQFEDLIAIVYHRGILAEVGDVTRFKDQAALANYAGLSWSRHQSGQFEAEQTHLVHSGNRYLRYYLVEATNHVRKHDPELQRFYDRKYNETPKSKGKRALVLTARKIRPGCLRSAA